MPDTITLVGIHALDRIIIPSSFAAQIENRTSVGRAEDSELALFRVGKGGWIIQAKATIRTTDTEKIDVQLRLTATEGSATVQDKALASAVNLGYATIVTVLGVHVSSSAQIALKWSKQGLSHADLTDIVITAIHQDNLTIGAM